jgi:hypothetical protein
MAALHYLTNVHPDTVATLFENFLNIVENYLIKDADTARYHYKKSFDQLKKMSKTFSKIQESDTISDVYFKLRGSPYRFVFFKFVLPFLSTYDGHSISQTVKTAKQYLMYVTTAFKLTISNKISPENTNRTEPNPNASALWLTSIRLRKTAKKTTPRWASSI